MNRLQYRLRKQHYKQTHQSDNTLQDGRRPNSQKYVSFPMVDLLHDSLVTAYIGNTLGILQAAYP